MSTKTLDIVFYMWFNVFNFSEGISVHCNMCKDEFVGCLSFILDTVLLLLKINLKYIHN